MTTALLLLSGALVLGRPPEAFSRRLFFLAALLGTIGEAACVALPWTSTGAGLWIYRFPPLLGISLPIPVWIPLVWGNLFVLFSALADRGEVRLRMLTVEGNGDGKEGEDGSDGGGGESAGYFGIVERAWRIVGGSLLVLYMLFLSTAISGRFLVIFLPLGFLILFRWNSLRDFLLFGIAAILGTGGEILAMRAGWWEYTTPLWKTAWLARWGIPGLPASLPMAWGISAVLLSRWARRSW